MSIDADAMTGIVGNPAHSVEFFGTSSAGSFLRQINSVIDSRLGGPEAEVSDLDGVSPLRSGNGSWGSERGLGPEDYTLPQRTFANKLVRAYFDLVWAVLPVHDWTIFQEAYEAVWLGTTPSAMPERLLHCFLNMAFALGSQFSEDIDPSRRRETGHAFWMRARKLFGPFTHEGASVERVQCMLIMGLYLQTTCETYECWMIIGSAIRMAQSLGLHMSTSTMRVPGRREVEIHRRVWHGCVFMDR